MAGCSAALHLAERGLQVALLEDNRIGWGASGRSGAQAIQGVAAGQAKLDRLIGPAAARAVWDVSIEGLALMRQLIRRFSIDCNWVDGYMLTAVKERHVRELRAELTELRDDYHYSSLRYMPRDELHATLATARYLGALYDSNSGHLHRSATPWDSPRRQALGEIFEGTRAVSFAASADSKCASRRRPASPRPPWCCVATSILAPRPRRWPARSWRSPPTSSPPSPSARNAHAR